MEQKNFFTRRFRTYFSCLLCIDPQPAHYFKGKNTNAQFGFTTTLFDLINRKSQHLAVCFDMEGPTERHTDFADYKANRQEAPEDLLAAIPDIKNY